MIYGLNFNQTAIPPDLARRFAKRLRLTTLVNGKYELVWFRLQGVATTNEHLNFMFIQADNGRRRLHAETRKIKGGLVYGVYTY